MELVTTTLAFLFSITQWSTRKVFVALNGQLEIVGRLAINNPVMWTLTVEHSSSFWKFLAEMSFLSVRPYAYDGALM